ncbi:MAG TPA: GGDEF domain-containing protein, partial [Acidimicrobiales bacterium]|nr:GGDEF domain-containing protein [Acidimicrobiales bacterium]
AVLVCIVGALGTGFVVATTGGSTQAGGTPFTTDDVFFVTLITAGIGVFVMAASGIRSLLERQVRELSGILGQVARTDPLTGCLDRRSFAERLRSEVKRAERYTQSLSLALIDVDRLTSINEKFGRETGDDFLAALGGLLRGWSRSTDVIGRIGGDEFAVLMPHTDPSAAAVHMHHIQERSKRIGNGHMSLSIGISGLDAARPRPEQIRRDAERALYTVKHTRKGDIVLGSPSDLCEEDFQTRRHAPSLTKIGSEESAARTIR